MRVLNQLFTNRFTIIFLFTSLLNSILYEVQAQDEQATKDSISHINKYQAFFKGDSLSVSQLNDSTYIFNNSDTLFLLKLVQDIEKQVKKQDTLKIVSTGTPEQAKPKNWKKKGTFNLNFSNVGLTNWASGGQSAISLGSIIYLEAVRETDQSAWTNSLRTAFGITKLNGTSIRKADDAIKISTQFSKKFSKKWSFSNKFEINTQLYEGISYSTDSNGDEIEEKISNFLAPGRFEVSTGVQYETKKEEFKLNGMFSPISGKLTMVLDDSVDVEDYGVEEGKKVLSEVGMQFTSELSTKFMQNVTFKNNLQLFANYLKLDKIDVYWETLLVLKVSKFLNTNFSTNLIYDDDIDISITDDAGNVVATGPRTQFKHVLNVGMNFIF
ncbi:DUF3078 domain-containing protein [Chondrinema litorale]|uniref:DUF3078 domain-containing protein n=1 Tax=Chondrinema litorale TaxID=2994555 RepID=UPI002542725F|nr:DUF3078 domain-containing protein [Chondrinema litorale]UZR94823.1 DUF3078 domain-containing protein [Chondrinema litorale]